MQQTAAERRDAHSAASLAATSQSPATPRTKFSPPKTVKKKRDETVKHRS